LEIVCTLLKGTLPTPEMFSVKPVEVLDPDPVDADDEVEVDEPVEPLPPMLTLCTVPFTNVVAAVPPDVSPANVALNV
jgi:hypothetical protein